MKFLEIIPLIIMFLPVAYIVLAFIGEIIDDL